jgi:hypothetical protein
MHSDAASQGGGWWQGCGAAYIHDVSSRSLGSESSSSDPALSTSDGDAPRADDDAASFGGDGSSALAVRGMADERAQFGSGAASEAS